MALTTVTVPANTTQQILASGASRWVSISSENTGVRLQYDGGDGTALSGSTGEPLPANGRLLLEGSPATNAIHARAGAFAARVTVQTGSA